MIGKIRLEPINDFELYNYDISFEIGSVDYCINIKTNLDQDFLTLSSSTKDLIDFIDNHIEYLQTNHSEDPDHLLILEQLLEIKKDPIKYIKNATYIQFDFENEEVLDYLKNNPVLKDKKILLKQNFDFDSNYLKEIKDKFKDYLDNLYFELPGNTNYISFKEYEATLTTLDKMAEEIKQYNFSPLEQIMYAYDILKNRVYKKENKDEDYSVSRDLSSSLLGEKIVCLGYARIFNTLLYKLGINCNEVILTAHPTGHARSEIHIKDDKYGINGVYYFDPTWDSKRDENDQEHLYTYRFFARTRKEMEKLERRKYYNKLFPCYYQTMDLDFEEQYLSGGIEEVDKDLIRSLNYMSRIIYHESLFKPFQITPGAPLYNQIDLEKTMETATELIEYFDKPIYAETLIKVLYNVKKQLYYTNPEKHPFDINSFYKTVYISHWSFEPNAEQRLLSTILGEEINNPPTPKTFEKFNNEQQLDKNIEQVKLAKTLRKVLENKLKK